MRKLTKKELFDQRTMSYFYPKTAPKVRIRHYDRIKMADLSSKGIKPRRETPGYKKLLWGKTYRDMQITEWKRDIMAGYITKGEIYESVWPSLRAWCESKLKYVPYDVDAYENIGTADKPHFVPTGRGTRPLMIAWSKDEL